MLGNTPPDNVQALQNGCHDNMADLRFDLTLGGPQGEARRVNAAFQLARGGWLGDARAHVPLLQALTNDGFESGMRAAMHALGW